MARPPFKNVTQLGSYLNKPPGVLSGLRRLLSGLCDLTAGGGSPQQPLDKIISIIATDLVAEFCAV